MNRNKVQTKKSPLFSLCIVFLLMTLPSASFATDLISVNGAGTGSGNRNSFKWPFAVITPDGRYIFFSSEASNLVTNDTNGNIQDLFVRDMQTGITTLVSVNSAGAGSGNGESFQPSFTPDGRYLAFSSDASDLIPNDANGTARDIFVRDMQTWTTTLVSINAAGTGSGNGSSTFPQISTDGRYVAFVSLATNLVSTNDTNEPFGGWDIFVRDLQTGTTTLVSVNAAGTGSGNQGGEEQGWTISPDGRYVAFTSGASDLVNNDTNSIVSDVFVRDLWMGTTTLVSVNATGTGSGNRESFHPAISSDGRYVAFTSYASDLVANDTNDMPDIFVRDLQTGTTTLVSVNAAGTASGNGGSTNVRITPNGRYIVFISAARDLVTNDINSSVNIFVRDMQTETTTLVSANDMGSGGNRVSEIELSHVISDDGRYVVFSSQADNLVDNDTENDIRDVFVRDLKLGTTTLLSRNTVGTHGNNESYFPVISANGNYVVFESLASDLVTNDSNGSLQDIYGVALGNEDTASLIAEVEALGAGGSLTQNQVDGLINKLHEIQAKLDNGQTGAACNQLSSFISQVRGFINSGTLTASQGQALIDAANAIKTSIGC